MGAIKAQSTRELFEQSVLMERRYGRLRRRPSIWRAALTLSVLLAGIGFVDGLVLR